MSRPILRLQNTLDSEVYRYIQKIQNAREAPETLSLVAVYNSIKRSNSSLSRRPKVILEDSIERVISVLREEFQEDATDQPKVASNSMNKHIARSLNPPPGAILSAEAAVSPEKSRKRDNVDIENAENDKRSSKKTKVSRTQLYPPPTDITLSDLGGMGRITKVFKKLVLLPMKWPERYSSQGVKIPRGVLLHGPPGCGKTAFCRAMAAEMKLPFISIAAPSIVSGMSGESEKQLRDLFRTAIDHAPCLLFIDEIDAITPKRESAQREMERRIVGQLLTSMDDLDLSKTGGKPVIVLAATNRPDSLDPALRRAGRFDTEINIGVPNTMVREHILRAQTRNTKLADDVDFKELAQQTPGYVGADLESLVFKANSISDDRFMKKLEVLSAQRAAEIQPANNDIADDDDEEEEEETISFRNLHRLLSSNQRPELNEVEELVTRDDFLNALPLVQPTAKREGFATIPETTWDNIGALGNVCKELKRDIVRPIKEPEMFEQMGITRPPGILLYGPPGCGKTLLAKAVANESRANFISVKGPELLNKYVGESEKAVRQVFFRARSSAPCVVFFDELDALAPRRDDSLSEASGRVVNTLLTEMDEATASSGIYVIAATNRRERIDPALLRGGRLGKHIFVGLPSPSGRTEILSTLLKKTPMQSLGLSAFAEGNVCHNFSGADLGSMVYEATQLALENGVEFVGLVHLEAAAEKIRQSNVL